MWRGVQAILLRYRKPIDCPKAHQWIGGSYAIFPLPHGVNRVRAAGHPGNNLSLGVAQTLAGRDFVAFIGGHGPSVRNLPQ